jgi:hypothetical protein
MLKTLNTSEFQWLLLSSCHLNSALLQITLGNSNVSLKKFKTVFLPVASAASRLRQLQLHEGQVQKGIHADYQLVGQQTITAAVCSTGFLPCGSSMAFNEFRLVSQLLQ